MEKQIEVENQQQKPSQPCSHQNSQSSSPTHDFSFTISHNSFNTTFPNNHNKSKLSSHNSFTALDLSPADDIFFHGHLLPLQILSHFPSSISPRSSTNSMDSFTLPIRELFSEDDDENLPTKDISSSNNSSKSENSSKNIESSKKVEVKKYLRKVKPLFKREKIREQKKSYSYSGKNVTPRTRNKQELMKGWSMKLGQYYSAPASMRTSPTNSGVLFATTPLPPPSDSSMEELQAAIQSAIAHCKNSYSKEEKLNC
ncbi:hypothetical protein MtrunA17_Chr1g0153661 [Medicago truncatula]|uniref:BRI1 kinase inhibitor 1 n=1 Tax=Medicago truncatula TaxID=3880 RepID=A0A396JKX4_MEDTR|nr:BRI1 kinase inhibitor 1 [Medicago truncatula]RHN77331.1 hypothetical protein MtrunA17_Chr1g0153661 [Medicago truncatula]